jgi:putative glutamine amidotransferase
VITRRPRIGLTMDVDPAAGRFHTRRGYLGAVEAAGALPILLPPGDGRVAAGYLALLDGLVVTGGAFDVPPELYGQARRAGCGPHKQERTRFEKDLLEAALAVSLPVLGICGGMQLLNVVRGGTLYQDLTADAGISGHDQREPREVATHAVRLAAGTHLARLAGAGQELMVNSTHHQAVHEPGTGVLVSATAPDGVIEAIELPDQPFALGVQWHPEALCQDEPRQAAIFAGLLAAARSGRMRA